MTEKMLSWKRKFISRQTKFNLRKKKIHSQEDKIRILEEKFSSLAGAEEERENFASFHTALNHGTNSTIQRNPEHKTPNGHVAQKRIVPGKGLEK